MKRLVRLDELFAEAVELCQTSARRARRVTLLVQLTAAALAASSCTAICTCANKFETACSESHGRVMQVGAQYMCVATDGMVIATWIADDDAGVP